MKQLPSPYIKFWWYFKRLNINDPLDRLFFLLASVKIINGLMKKLVKEKQK